MLNKKPASRQALENLKRIPVDTDAPQQRWSARRRVLATVAACALTISMIPAAGLAAAGATGTNFDQPEVNEPTTTEAASSSNQPAAGADAQADKAVNDSEKKEVVGENADNPSGRKGLSTESIGVEASSPDSAKESVISGEETPMGSGSTLSDSFLPAKENLPLVEDAGDSSLLLGEAFTDAGPFMAPVDVSVYRNTPMRKARAVRANTGNALDSIVMEGSLKETGENETFALSVSTYIEGETKTIPVTTTIPADIVLVLDNSQHMGVAMDGSPATETKPSRNVVMKNAVKKFLQDIKDKNTDSRVAIVCYGNSDATRVLGGTSGNPWVVVRDNVEELQNIVEGISDPQGGSAIGKAMGLAKDLLTTKQYTVPDDLMAKRAKAIVVFSSGVPSTDEEPKLFDVGVANGAVNTATSLKADGSTAVYTIGCFDGAKAVGENSLYGQSLPQVGPLGVFDREVSANGNEGDCWGYSKLGEWAGTENMRYVDIPANNRFLNCLSSNYSDSSIHLRACKDDHWVLFSKVTRKDCWHIEKKIELVRNGYYLSLGTENPVEDLNKIFATISSNIQNTTANFELSDARIRITLPEYLELAGTSEASTMAATDQSNSEEWWAPQQNSDITLSGLDEDRTIEISGYDFAKNYVARNEGRGDDQKFYGEKLVVDIPVKFRKGFMGGNQIPVALNIEIAGKAGGDESAEIKTIKSIPSPMVDVPIPQITSSDSNLDVYLLGNIDAQQIAKASSLAADGIALDASKDDLGLEAWQIAGVSILCESGCSGENLTSMTQDAKVTQKVTLTPKYSAGSAKESAGEATVNIRVFKPELELTPVEVWYGQKLENGSENKLLRVNSTVWKHGATVASAAMEPSPALTAVTSLADGSESAVQNDASGDKYLATADSFVVDARVDQSGQDITEYASFAGHSDNSNAYSVIPKWGKLTLSAKDAVDDGQGFVFRINANDNFVGSILFGNVGKTVAVKNGEAVTLTKMPIGWYKIAEDSEFTLADWGWRYKPLETPSASFFVPMSSRGAQVTCKASSSDRKAQWLSGESFATNVASSGALTQKIMDQRLLAAL